MANKFIDDRIRENLSKLDLSVLWPLFKECTPKLLVVTDGLNYSSSDDFGLTEFVQTLRSATIHGMTPLVITATHNPNPAAAIAFDSVSKHIDNFKFDDATHGVVKRRYDVVFILGFNRENSNEITDGGLTAVSKFMQDGGGVFATGDHEDLGAALSRRIPRVRNMRFWRANETPNAANTTRLSTNLPGANNDYEFDDQADRFPQRLYVNYRTQVAGVGNPHPVLQLPRVPRFSRFGLGLGLFFEVPAIEVFPDHPHEGECRVPTDLNTTFTLDGNNVDEWPRVGGGARLSPEMVALTMSHGDSFPGKEALVPRSFMAICAYNGHAANVGRVVTDATWHHFVNVNIKRGPPAPADRRGLTGTDLDHVQRYYRNLASWLMPATVRRCLRFITLATELKRFPLLEELRLPPLSEATGEQLHDIGRQVHVALASRLPKYELDELIDDALVDGAGAEPSGKLRSYGRRFGDVSAEDIGLAALGALTIGTAEAILDIVGKEGADAHKVLEPMAKEVTRVGVRRYLDDTRRQVREIDALLIDMCK
jgi:hypothetical protein